MQCAIFIHIYNMQYLYPECPHRQFGLKVAWLQDRIPAVAELHRFIPCTIRSGGTAHEGGWGCDQSNGSTVSDAIFRSWLWSTVTMSSLFSYFSRLLQVVDN